MLFVVCTFGQTKAQGQFEKVEKSFEKNFVSGNILGASAYLGFTYERQFFNHLNAEVGLGLIGYGFGVIYYPIKPAPNKIRPYIGVKQTALALVDLPFYKITYLPVGLTYYFRKYINIGFDIGISNVNHVSGGYHPSLEEMKKYPYSTTSIYGNLKLGFRF